MVRATDQWYQNGQASLTFALDRIAPSVSIHSGPGSTSGRSAEFSFVADDVPSDGSIVLPYASGLASVQCQLDDRARQDCDETASFGFVPDGEHTFTVYAVDRAGNESSDVYTWTVDGTAPVVTADPIAPYLKHAPATLDWSVDDATASVTCAYLIQTMTGPVTSEVCSNPFPLSDVEGLHVHVIVATDSVGNSGSSNIVFVVDRTAPQLQWVATPPLRHNASTATFAINASDAGLGAFVAGISGFECELDGENLDACPANLVFDDLEEGPHSLAISAIDRAGNVSTPIEWEWEVDTTPPVVAIDDVPRYSAVEITGPIAFTVDDPEASLLVLARLLLLRRIVDDAHPLYDLRLQSRRHRRRRVHHHRPGDGRRGQRRRRLGGVHRRHLRPDDHPRFRTRRHRLAEHGRVRVHHLRRAPGTVRLGSDGLVLARLGAVGGVLLSRDLRGSRRRSSRREVPSEAAFSDCALNGEAVPCASPIELADLEDGDHVVTIEITDSAGNTEVASVEWTVDTVAPAVRFDAAAESSGSTATFVFSTTDTASAPTALTIAPVAAPIQLFECSLDGAAFTACSSPLTLTGLTVGEHELAVRATDAAGNEGEAAAHEWRVTAVGGAGDPGALAGTGSSIPDQGLLGAVVLAALGGMLVAWRRRATR